MRSTRTPFEQRAAAWAKCYTIYIYNDGTVQHIQYIVQRERGNSIVRARSFCGQSDAVSQRITAACLHMSSGLMAVLHCLWPLELERPIYT